MPPQHSNRRKAKPAAHFLKISHLSLVLLTYVLTLLVFYQQEGMQPLALFSAALLVTADIALFYLIFRSGWNARMREPELAIPQIAAALAILCCVAYLDRSTQIIFGPFVLVVLLFGVCRLSITALVAMSITCLGAFLLLILVRGYQQDYPASFRSDLMQWFILAVALTSVVAVSSQIRKLRKVLEITQYQLEHYEEKAIRDELTGLYNRRQLQIELEQARLRAVLSSVPFCLCLLDIDHFKEINDKCGHLVGDMVLREFAQVARDSIRSSDIFGRYGGDEFMKILPDTDLKGAVMHAERLRVHAHFLDFQKILSPPHISISIGVAQYRDGEDATALIARADAALYRAKKLGRNRVEWIE
jgi:diguanylate cyclase (GGDEF)-like protein